MTKISLINKGVRFTVGHQTIQTFMDTHHDGTTFQVSRRPRSVQSAWNRASEIRHPIHSPPKKCQTFEGNKQHYL